MVRLKVAIIACVMLGCCPAYAQVAHTAISTNQCPVTHGCRPVAQGMQQNHVVANPSPTGMIQCPPGTYHIPNTNKCRVR